MQILIGWTLLMTAVLSSAWGVPRVSRSEPVLVRAVFDGDTIDVATIGRVRLLGIDAPEVAHTYETAAPFGKEARERLMALQKNFSLPEGVSFSQRRIVTQSEEIGSLM